MPHIIVAREREGQRVFWLNRERKKFEDHCHHQAILLPSYDLKNSMMGLFDNELGHNRFYW